MSNQEDYEWRRRVQPGDFGCIAVIGLSVIVCTGVIKYGYEDGRFSISQQAGENVYVFKCNKNDKPAHVWGENTNWCLQEKNLWAVYEQTTLQNWQHAPKSWLADTSDKTWCSRDSSLLGQCYQLEEEKRKKFFEEYSLDKSIDDAKFDRDLNRNNGM